MAVQGVGAGWRPHVEPRGCLEVIEEIVRKVVDAVASFFAAIGDFFNEAFNFLFCIPKDPNPPDVVDEIQQPNDVPVDLDALRAILRRGEGNAQISSRMTAQDFSALCTDYPIHFVIRNGAGAVLRDGNVEEISQIQPIFEAVQAEVQAQGGDRAAVQETIEFPQARTQIGLWAEQWALNRTLKIDPAHPYFEIFQRAFELKDQIHGGVAQSGDYRTYSVTDEAYLQAPLFLYIIKSLIGFQEFSREENRILLRQLDNYKSNFSENPCYKFARKLAKLYCYPTANRNGRFAFGEVPMDVKNKLQIGIGAPMEVFRLAVNNNRVLDYFNSAFQNKNCFDYRVSQLQEFAFGVAYPHVEDFSPNVAALSTTREYLIEYHRTFKNKQAFAMSRERHLNYENLKAGRNPAHQATLYQEYCTKDRFEQYLQENGHPVRELVATGQYGDRVLPMIPVQDDWRGTIPKGFKSVPLNLIPAARRVVGGNLTVLDPTEYMATVVQPRMGGHALEFSRQKAVQWQDDHHPLLDYQRPWRGVERAAIFPDDLPLNRRVHGNRVRIKDPALYQVKIHQINADTALIDFRGEPVTRAQWEAALPNNEYWTP